MSRYAYGYDLETDEAIRVAPGVLDAEAYGVKSSARGMLKFLDAELGNAVIASEPKAAIHRTQEGQFKTATFTQNMIWERYPWSVPLETMTSGNGHDFILRPQSVEKTIPTLSPQKNAVLNKTGSTNGVRGYVAMLPCENLGGGCTRKQKFSERGAGDGNYSLIEALLTDSK